MDQDSAARHGPTSFDDEQGNQFEKERVRPGLKPQQINEGTSPPEPMPQQISEPVEPVGVKRITKIKTFVAETSPEALRKLDEAVANFLQSDPAITVKQISVQSAPGGMNAASLVVMLWY